MAIATAPHPTQQGPRVGYVVTGALTAVIALCLAAVGAVALWGDGQKDADGYLSTGSHRFATTTSALVSERLDVDLDGKDWVVGVEDLGDVRLRVDPESPGPVFAGVARTADVDAYLRGVGHTLVTDVESGPFTADQSDRPGARTAPPPAEQDIWAASVQGSGPQTLDWKATDGDWSAVVMNADGSPGLIADVSAGAEVAFLDDVGWSTAGAGLVLLLVGGGLIAAGVRRRHSS